eukprot:4913704-Pyramimonas_sp.AAC.2
MYDKIQAVMKTISEVTQMLEGVANDLERLGNLLVWADPTVTSRFVMWGSFPVGVALIVLWNLLIWLARHISINEASTPSSSSSCPCFAPLPGCTRRTEQTNQLITT